MCLVSSQSAPSQCFNSLVVLGEATVGAEISVKLSGFCPQPNGEFTAITRAPYLVGKELERGLCPQTSPALSLTSILGLQALQVPRQFSFPLLLCAME